MSKAFVKDDSATDFEFNFEPIELNLQTYYVTPTGLKDLQDELLNLRDMEKQPQDGQFGKTLKKRIQHLEKTLQKSEVIDPAQQSGKKARFGATVTVLDEEENKRTYRIVGLTEVNSENGKVSYISPIGKALLGSQAGDVVLLETPQGEEELEILNVQFAAID